MARPDFRTRLSKLEAALHERVARLTMPDGAVIQVPASVPMDVFVEVIAAGREGRKPQHPYMEAVLEAVDEIGGGTLCKLSQVLISSRERHRRDDAPV